jgi:hypothetical protein
MNNKLARMWKEVVMATKDLHLPGGTEENHKNYQESQSLGRDLNLGTSQVQSKSANHSTVVYLSK